MEGAGINAARLSAALATLPNGPLKPGPKNYYPAGDQRPTPPAPPLTSDNLGTEWGLFGRAAKDLAVALSIRPPSPQRKCPVGAAPLNAEILAALDPARTMAAAYAGRLQLVPSRAWRGADPLGTVYIAPEFPQPAFEPLRKLSQEWAIPGLDQVPLNTVGVLESNQRFIEAYMVGLNFELARELVWNGFPTDQRGSYFRTFWDHTAALTPIGEAPDPQSRYDIDAITRWTKALGKNPNPQGLPEGALFLLIRGDLLRRYPNALLYATRAVVGIDGKRAFPDLDAVPPPQEMHPLFSGVLRPDVSFFAFNLTAEAAAGDPSNPNNASNPGWYFVLQEHAAETRFGLDAADHSSFKTPLSDWMHINWGNFAADEAALSRIAYIDLEDALPDTTQAQNPADPATTGLAWHSSQGSRASDIAYVTLRDPVRVAIHASRLLPGGI